MCSCILAPGISCSRCGQSGSFPHKTARMFALLARALARPSANKHARMHACKYESRAPASHIATARQQAYRRVFFTAQQTQKGSTPRPVQQPGYALVLPSDPPTCGYSSLSALQTCSSACACTNSCCAYARSARGAPPVVPPAAPPAALPGAPLHAAAGTEAPPATTTRMPPSSSSSSGMPSCRQRATAAGSVSAG